MLLSEIHHKHTLNAINQHQINEEQLKNINSLEELHLIIRRYSRKKWYNQNKQYFKNKYKNEYKDKVLPKMREQMSNKYYLNLLPSNF